MSSTGFPDPFAKISVDGSGQVYSTNAVKGTLDPKWNTHYDLYLSKGDGITIRLVNKLFICIIIPSLLAIINKP